MLRAVLYCLNALSVDWLIGPRLHLDYINLTNENSWFMEKNKIDLINYLTEKKQMQNGIGT